MLEANDMLKELKSNKLKVALFDAPDPIHYSHKVRVAIERNVDWYRDLFAEDQSLKRQHSIQALTRISKGDINLNFKYHRLFLRVILDRLKQEN